MVTAEDTVEERHFSADPREHTERQTHTRTPRLSSSSFSFAFQQLEVSHIKFDAIADTLHITVYIMHLYGIHIKLAVYICTICSLAMNSTFVYIMVLMIVKT